MHSLRRFILLPAAVVLCTAAPSVLCAQKQVIPFVRALQQETLRFVPQAQGLCGPHGLLSPRYWLGLQPAAAVSPGLLQKKVAAQLPRMPAPAQLFPGKARIDAVIFDLDGTLLDSLSAWEHSGSNFLRTQGIVPPPGLDEELAKMSLSDGARLLKKRFHLPQSPEEILRLTLEPIRRHYYEDIPPKPGVLSLLRRLHAQGIKLCVATASDRELTEAALKRTGLLPYFDFILTCDEAGAGKRNPAVYQLARQKLGTALERTLVVEDALYALQTARSAGFATAAIAEPHAAKDQPALQATADYYFRSFLQCQLGK